MQLRILLCAILVTLLIPGSVRAQPEQDANKLFAEGLRLYVEKNYEEAAKVLEQAYDAKAEQRTLFAWAQATRLSGKCEESKELLTQYVANGANGKQSRAAFKLMEDCEPKAESETDEGSTDDGSATDTTDDSEENENSTDTEDEGSQDAFVTETNDSDLNEKSPWYTDPVALGLLASGVVGVAVGSYSYSEALSLEEEGMEPGTDHGEFLRLKGEAEDNRKIAVIAGATGAVLIGAGITYLVLRDPLSGEEEDPSLVLHLGSESAGFAFMGRF